VTVVGTPAGLSLTEPSVNVTMGPITLNGNQQSSPGALQPVTLTDIRGTLPGWTVTAQFRANDFTGPTPSPDARHFLDYNIPVSDMGQNLFALGAATMVCAFNTTPTPSCNTADLNTPIASNTPLTGPAGSPVTIAQAAAGGGGGTWLYGSGVSMVVPAYVFAQTYTNTLNITAQ
jgi:hypothetical protein